MYLVDEMLDNIWHLSSYMDYISFIVWFSINMLVVFKKCVSTHSIPTI